MFFSRGRKRTLLKARADLTHALALPLAELAHFSHIEEGQVAAKKVLDPD